MTVTELQDREQRSRICREILSDLPGWFGLAESNERYEREVADLPTFVAGDDAFLSLKLHSGQAAEVHVMGVQPERQAAEEYLRQHPSERYEQTRRFYASRGFVPLEELSGIWGEDNPCLILVKHLACR